ncbi:carboxymuconolactone decarboxylase family protein [Spirosoma radiotolerans]|uniref:Carboxymuconolactone decarboxylase n=1 Tax=Spirosoma radiotolerans TaxID=1379870 RepID=A0A0E3ZT27_9BACT|nr:carboxymuconolactone decarboxylase [Spirosoma radiotolerans]AKD53843.1 carboxymuconolactone decarboxylase [Spirosoma radiotolerans]
MPHIQLAEGLPGITGPMAFSPQTAKPLNDLAEVLLRTNASDSLTQGERELIASYVSKRNECLFCSTCHGAVADYVLGPEKQTVAQTWEDPTTAPISAKLKALLVIADSVRQGGQCVSPEQITTARQQGATDQDIHDTVLISAAFSMFNRYVDGLATWAPADPAAYGQMGAMLATQGYAAQTPSAQPSSI